MLKYSDQNSNFTQNGATKLKELGQNSPFGALAAEIETQYVVGVVNQDQLANLSIAFCSSLSLC